MKLGIRIGSRGKHKAKGEQNIKVLLKLFQKLAKGCGGEEPPQASRAKRPREVSKQRRGTIRWMVPLNVFADPRGTAYPQPVCPASLFADWPRLSYIY